MCPDTNGARMHNGQLMQTGACACVPRQRSVRRAVLMFTVTSGSRGVAPRLAGIDRADSIVWDAHKMAMMPALATAVLYRDGARSFGAFAQEASYLFDGVDPAAEWWNLGGRTLECTKRMMGLPLWVALHVYGTRFFAEHVERTYDLARWLAARLRAEPDFEVAHEPDANILCFRHRPEGEQDLDALQPRLRRRVNEGGGHQRDRPLTVRGTAP